MGSHVGTILGGLGFQCVFIEMSPTTHVCSGRHSIWFRVACQDAYVDTLCVQFDVIACRMNVNVQSIENGVVCVDTTINISCDYSVVPSCEHVHTQCH